MKKITTTSNFQFIQDSFIEAKTNAKKEAESMVVDPDRLKGVGLEGASRCFAKGTLVRTSKGLKPIESVKKGDYVKSCSPKNGSGYKKVLESHFFPKNQKKMITINFKDGRQIKATYDHEFYFEGGWVKLKDLVSLFNDRMEKNKKL